MTEIVPYLVTTQAPMQPLRSHQLMARNPSHAISSALELSGPGARVVRCVRQGDW